MPAGLARKQIGRTRFDLEACAAEAGADALSEAEVATLAGQIGEAPAGGDALAVIGIVFVVLVILELVGVIDIFKKT